MIWFDLEIKSYVWNLWWKYRIWIDLEINSYVWSSLTKIDLISFNYFTFLPLQEKNHKDSTLIFKSVFSLVFFFSSHFHYGRLTSNFLVIFFCLNKFLNQKWKFWRIYATKHLVEDRNYLCGNLSWYVENLVGPAGIYTLSMKMQHFRCFSSYDMIINVRVVGKSSCKTHC